MIPLIDFALPSIPLGRVLFLGEDPPMQEAILTYMNCQQCDTAVLQNPGEAIDRLRGGGFGMVLLHQKPNDADGLDVLRRIRARSDIPVILLTRTPADEVDRILSLELGADDYLVWPFHPRELMARARAIVRRQELGRVASSNLRNLGGYRFLGWELRRRSRSLTDPNGTPLTLTKGEYSLLTAFLESPQRILSRAQLLQATRTHEDVYDRSIDVQVLRLRRKLQAPGAPSPSIVTKRGVGYCFDTPVERLF
nr:response regulator transcription factor [uncultured Sphingomonas sp.]